MGGGTYVISLALKFLLRIGQTQNLSLELIPSTFKLLSLLLKPRDLLLHVQVTRSEFLTFLFEAFNRLVGSLGVRPLGLYFALEDL